MDLNKLFWIFILVVCSIPGYSQEQNQNLSKLGFFNGDIEKMLLVEAGKSFKNSDISQPKSNVGNNVFIQQVGINNDVSTVVSSGDALINLDQNGINNNIFLRVRANVVRENVEQIGNSNFFFNFVNNPFKENHLNVKQQGNYNLVVKYGANSISDKIQYDLKGDFRSLIIINNP